MKKFLVLLFLFGLLSPESNLWAKSKGSSFAFSSSYNSIQDIKIGSSTSSNLEQSSLSVELGVRYFRTHQLVIVSSQTIDNLRSDFGLGLRFDLPGFFYIGATAKKLQARQRSYPVNTSGYFTTGLADVQDAGTRVQAAFTQWGFTMDFFLFNKVTFLTTNFSVYSLQGNSYLVSGAGLGAEF